MMESPPYWVAVHRMHHQHADDAHDPHSPLKSFFWSHFGWYMISTDPTRRQEVLHRYAPDVMRDPLYAFLEYNHNWVGLVVISWLTFFGAAYGAAIAFGVNQGDAVQFGASVLVWGVFVRTVEVFQATMCVNSITHLWGYRNYDTKDNSKNNFWVAMLTTGEGWHNNHHADPRSARHGHAPGELDVAWLTIRLLRRMGLAWDVAPPSPNLAAPRRVRSIKPVCTENLVRLDLVTESLTVGRDGGAPPVFAEPAWLALQVQEPACGRERRAPTAAGGASAQGVWARRAHQ
jgi:stearoyl-CoA desaturase (delta-9 desaturase)